MPKFIQLTYVDTEDGSFNTKFKPVEVATVEDMEKLFNEYYNVLFDALPMEDDPFDIVIAVPPIVKDDHTTHLTKNWGVQIDKLFS